MAEESGGIDTTPWKVGDMALCVNDGLITCEVAAPNPGTRRHNGEYAPKKGTVREVKDVGPSLSKGKRFCDCLALSFDGAIGVSQRFIKVTPIEEDNFDRETIILEKKAVKKRIKELSE